MHIYYPIATDPEGRFQTFDEKLDVLIQRRRELAAEFLAPMPGEEELGQELLNDLLQTPIHLDSSSGVHTLSREDVRRLSPDRFEALIAVLEEKRGAHVLLTPVAGDDGIDVIAMRSHEVLLIQCKHTLWDARVDADVIAEVVRAFDGYRACWLRALSHTCTLRPPIIVTNGTFTRKARREAKERDVKLVAQADLWSLLDGTPCTPGEVTAMQDRRLASMRDVQAAIELSYTGS